MQYNTARELMPIREYGRGVHDMVKYLLTIEDKETRQKNAEAIALPHLSAWGFDSQNPTNYWVWAGDRNAV